MRSDQELVEEVRIGDRKAFSELVRRHQKSMMRLALRLTRDLNMAEDIVQDSFIKAFQKIDLFEGRASFKSWLYQITLNTARNKLRTVHRESASIDTLTLSESSVAETRLVDIDIKSVVRGEIAKLPSKQRRALSLRIFDDLSFKEIAQIMDCPYDTAKANYRHALLKLKKRMEGNSFLKNWKPQDDSLSSHFGARLAEVE